MTQHPKTQEVARLIYSGSTIREVQERLSLTTDEIRDILDSEAFSQALKDLTTPPSDTDVREMFEELSKPAVEIFKKAIMGEEVDSKQLRAATNILDRAGYTPVRKVATITLNLSPSKSRKTREIAAELLDES